MQRPTVPGGGIGPVLTPFARTVLVALVGLFVFQLVVERWLGLPVLQTLAWWPFGTGMFRPWQVVTCYLLNGPGVLNAVFDWIFIFFLLPPVEQMYGRLAVIRMIGFTVILSAVVGLLFLVTGVVVSGGPWLGLNPLLTALLVLFGLARPNAQILLFFVLPIKAGWVAWGSGLLALLNLLAERNLESALWATGWLGGYLWIQMQGPGGVRRPLLKLRQHLLQRKLKRFEVLDGGQEPGGDDWVH